MAIDFTFPPEIDALRVRVRDFIAQLVRPAEARIAEREGDRRFLIQWRIAPRTIEAFKRDQSTRTATGNLPL